MGNINIGRLFISGLIIGIINNVVYGIANGVVLASQWTAALTALGRPPFTVGDIVIFNLWGFVAGFGAAWIYAGFRPRFGAGMRTAVYVALTVWVLSYLVPFAILTVIGVPIGLMSLGAVIGLVVILVATPIGMYFYNEKA